MFKKAKTFEMDYTGTRCPFRSVKGNFNSSHFNDVGKSLLAEGTGYSLPHGG
jgi:hypothetical protein